MPTEIQGIKSSDVRAKIKLLIDGMVNIKDKTGEFLLKLDDGRVIDTKGWNDWEWTHGVGLYGIWQYYELTGDEQCLEIIEAWFANRFAAGGTTKNINTMAVFLTLAYVYEKTKNPTYLPWLDSWAEWAYRDLDRTRFGGMQHVTYVSLHEGQLWDDTLMMTVLPLAKIGLVLNRPHYVAEAKKQFILHCQYLFDTKTGLFFHGWEFFKDGAKQGKLGHNFAEARWARGNSWLTIVIPEFIELLNLDVATDPIGSHLRDVLEAQCSALTSLQASSGLWRTLLDIPEEEGSYPEASATAGFAFGILKSRRKRYLDASSPVSAPEADDCRKLKGAKVGGYDEVAVKAIKAVIDNVDENGELLNTSFGTAMGGTLQHYKDIPITSMPYGQAMAIMALVEFLRVYI
ncbi:putative glycosyl hydrolase family 88 [Diaporthe ampelina]|uniref:Putative glycosyl hydrolase family 88 n=1 Tax=Diaporthe ampelina TaxID=1214573 RepID=A0A0G2FM01_9PEZI|nr:putative glycosyl hydrolase family 88 [Diaporthe ampelina]